MSIYRFKQKKELEVNFKKLCILRVETNYYKFDSSFESVNRIDIKKIKNEDLHNEESYFDFSIFGRTYTYFSDNNIKFFLKQ